jgi:pimeloyl-ACP methyl ester carboxylesterase
MAATSPDLSLNDLRWLIGTINPAKLYKLSKPLVDYLYFGFDAYALGTTYQVPVYLFTGEYDTTTPLELTQAYYEQINAPAKKLIKVRGVGHYLYGDNPQLFTQLVLDNLLSQTPEAGANGQSVDNSRHPGSATSLLASAATVA